MNFSYAFRLIATLLILSAGGCKSSMYEAVQGLPGTYVRAGQHEFGKEYDTLTVSLVNEAAGQYCITRNWQYERVLDGKTLNPEYKSTTATAFYDENTRALKDERAGRLYVLDTDGQTLVAGSNKYG